MKKILIGLAVFIVSVVAVFHFGKQPAKFAAESKSAGILLGGSHAVKSSTFTLEDKTRPIQANGDFEGAPTRTFDVFLWAPATKPEQPMPLVIYSHGFMSTGEGGDYLGKHLASMGYTVAAATFPLTHYTAPGGPNTADVVNQPADVSFIIDHLLARNSDSNDVMHQYIDTQRIAAVGLSLGGMTTKLVAYHPERADKRITAAISIAGLSFTFSKRFFADRSIPFMMIATPQDAMVAYKDNAANILEKIPGAVLVTIDGASHAGFSSTAKWLKWMDNPDSIGCDTLMANVELEVDQTWYKQLGTAEIGVMPPTVPDMCNVQPLPKAINPLRQHQLNTLAVSSFLQCHFGQEPQLVEQNCQYLNADFAQEVAEVSVSTL